MQIKISVVIPTYQRIDMLKTCLLALDEQTIHPAFYEVIAVDDQSPNFQEKKEVIEGHPYQYSFQLILAPKGGPAKARNLGARLAKGDVVVFLDDDTIPTPTWLEEILKAFEKSSHAGIGGMTYNVKTKTLSEKLLHHVNHLHSPTDPVSQQVTFLVTVNAAFQKRVFEEIGGFDEDFKLPCGEDIDFGYRVRKKGYTLGVAQNAVVLHHQRDTLKGMFKNWYLYGKGIYRCQHKHQKELSQLDSYSDTTLLGNKKLLKHVNDYFGLYASLWKDPEISWWEFLLIPNLHVVNFLYYLAGRFSEARLLRAQS